MEGMELSLTRVTPGSPLSLGGGGPGSVGVPRTGFFTPFGHHRMGGSPMRPGWGVRTGEHSDTLYQYHGAKRRDLQTQRPELPGH